MIYHDVLVVGAGLAGLRAAIEASDKGADVAVVSKVHPVRSHSVAAQGGINAALANNPAAKDDTPEKHMYDTVKGSDFLADQDAAQVLTFDAPKRVFELEHWGCPFSRTEDGKIAQRPFGGAGYPRTCYGSDRTGHYMLHTLYQQCLKRNIKFYEEFFVIKLVIEDKICRGVIAVELSSGALTAMAASAVIYATGGSGRIYGRTTNAHISTGLGVAIPYWAGVPLKDMEFTQFHPTGITGKYILMTEGCRGEGGYLFNNAGERFMRKYVSEKFMELAPRDIVARSMQTEINEGRGIGGGKHLHLDLRHLGAKKIKERLMGIREICIDFLGIDPVKTPIPVLPVMHYSMGGIDTNAGCETEINGFFAAGECSCASVHGANRLGGNSLLETVVFGRVAGEKAAESLKRDADANIKIMEKALPGQQKFIDSLFKKDGRINPYTVKNKMSVLMDEKVGIFREEHRMTEARKEIKGLQEEFSNSRPVSPGKTYNYDLLWYLEMKGSMDIAEIIIEGALARKESRGSHFRKDYNKRDDINWLKHTVAVWSPEGPKLFYKPVRITRFQPEERKY